MTQITEYKPLEDGDFESDVRLSCPKKKHNHIIFFMGKWGEQNDRTSVKSIFGYQFNAPKCLFFYILGVTVRKVKNDQIF